MPRVSLFPYALLRVPGTRRIYSVLNREYAPIGFHPSKRDRRYRIEDLPIYYRVTGLTQHKARLISWPNPNFERCWADRGVFLYNDGCIPFVQDPEEPARRQAATDAYLKRLEVLASLKFDPCEPIEPFTIPGVAGPPRDFHPGTSAEVSAK